jgi:hypothetical protein
MSISESAGFDRCISDQKCRDAVEQYFLQD